MILVFGREEAVKEAYKDTDLRNRHLVESAGEWIRCPNCESKEDSFVIYWEKTDFNFKCNNCGEAEGVR